MDLEVSERVGVGVALEIHILEYSIRISGRIQAILTEDFVVFPQSIQPNAGIVPRLGHSRFFPKPFEFIRSVGIATGCTAGVQFPAEARDLFLLHSVQTGSGAHPASYPMSTKSCFPEVKRSGRQADHSLASSAGAKNGGAIPLLPICLHGAVLN
jgi:hypothetical protein